jgi:hypothetical protein
MMLRWHGERFSVQATQRSGLGLHGEHGKRFIDKNVRWRTARPARGQRDFLAFRSIETWLTHRCLLSRPKIMAIWQCEGFEVSHKFLVVCTTVSARDVRPTHSFPAGGLRFYVHPACELSDGGRAERVKTSAFGAPQRAELSQKWFGGG